MVPTFHVFNANQGITLEKTVPTTDALTTIGQPLVTTNQSVQNRSVDYAEKRDTLLPTALLMTTGIITTSSKMKGMLETELVT